MRRQTLLALWLLRGLEPLVPYCSQEERLTAELERMYLDHHLSLRSILIAKTTLKMNNKIGDLTLPDIKTYNKAVIFKTVWYWHKYRYR